MDTPKKKYRRRKRPTPKVKPTVTVSVTMTIAGRAFEIDVVVPEGPATWTDLLPAMRALSDLAAGIASEDAAAEGNCVSCAVGCAACCHHVVPLAPFEASQLRELVARMPDSERKALQSRLTATKERLDGSELGEVLASKRELSLEEGTELGVRYARARIPCPFLVENQCSIYAMRPLKCREYMVTSPAEYCADPSAGDVNAVSLPLRVFGTSLDLEGAAEGQRKWVALTHAFGPAPDTEPAPTATGPELLDIFLNRLAARNPRRETSDG